MILLSLGTHYHPFPRALDLVEPLARRGERLIIQYGTTPPRVGMPNTTWMEFMGFDEVEATMTEVDGVVCHAGVGTIMTALGQGHTPVVIPRQAKHGEHVDDHQIDIATRFAERGLVRCVTSETDLLPLFAARTPEAGRRLGRGSTQLRTQVSLAVAARVSHRRWALWH